MDVTKHIRFLAVNYLVGGAAERSGWSNASGRANLRYIKRAGGMPFTIHWETAAGVT